MDTFKVIRLDMQGELINGRRETASIPISPIPLAPIGLTSAD